MWLGLIFSVFRVFWFHIVYNGVKRKDRLARADEEAACPFSVRTVPILQPVAVAVACGPGLTNYKFPSCEFLLPSSIFVQVHVYGAHEDSHYDGRPDAQTPFSAAVHIAIRAHGTGWTALAVVDIFDH